MRIQADLARLAAYGIGWRTCAPPSSPANVAGPKGSLDGAHRPTPSPPTTRSQRRGLQAGHRRLSQRRAGAPRRRRHVIDGAGERRTAAGTRARRPSSSTSSASPAPTSSRWSADQGGAAAAAARDAGRRQADHRARPHRHHPRLGARRAVHADPEPWCWWCWWCCCSCARLRATIIAGVALPLSLVATFGVMYSAASASTTCR